MSELPRILPSRLAEPGTLAGDWIAGEPRARALLPPDGPSADGRTEAASGGASSGSGAGRGPADRPGSDGSDGGSAPRVGLEPEAFGVSEPAAGEKLRRILAGEGALVTTGQQPLLFLGPCLVLYKALTAIERARQLEEATGRPHLASFWIASDDHDWDEVGTVRLLDTKNRLRRVRLEAPEGWADRPAGPAPLPGSVEERLREFLDWLPETEFADRILGLLEEAWRPGTRLADAFAGTLTRALPGRAFVWLDAAAPALKRAAAPVVRWALERGNAVRAALREGAEGLRDAGYEPSIPLLEEATPVFLDTGRARERLYERDGGFTVGREGERLPRHAVFERLEDAPGAFGPNVALRPVVESALLPVAATVLGPGEIAYWAQLGPLFRAGGRPPPPVRARAGWTLLEGKVAKVLEKVEADVEALADGGAALAREVTRGARPPAVEEALGELKAALGRALERVEARVADELPGIRSAVGKTRSQAFRAVAELEAQVDARVRERQDVLLAQIRKAAVHLFPDGRPQERVTSPFYYLVRYGPGLLDTIQARTAETLAGRVAGAPHRR